MRGELAISGEVPAAKSVSIIASRKMVAAKMATGEVMAEMPAAEMAKVTSAEMTEVPATEMTEVPAAEVSEVPAAEVSEMAATEMVTAEMASAKVAEVSSAEIAATEISSFGRGNAQRIEGDQRNAGNDRPAHCAKHFMAPM